MREREWRATWGGTRRGMEVAVKMLPPPARPHYLGGGSSVVDSGGGGSSGGVGGGGGSRSEGAWRLGGGGLRADYAEQIWWDHGCVDGSGPGSH